jgi:hypothetical protein
VTVTYDPRNIEKIPEQSKPIPGIADKEHPGAFSAKIL